MSKASENAATILAEAKARGTVLALDLWYPGLEGHVDTIEIGLMDVRAADSIRIRYDFQRDGYAILQASTFEWEADDTVCDGDWQEVAFVPAWQREKPSILSKQLAAKVRP